LRAPLVVRSGDPFSRLLGPVTSPLAQPSPGLCALGVVRTAWRRARAEQGYEVDQIANDIGMSRQNVEHYMRFKDQMKVAADGQKRLRLVNTPDVSK
jgi:hypothetical protein